MNNDKLDQEVIKHNLALMQVIEKLEEEIAELKNPEEEEGEIAISQLAFYLENSMLAFIAWDKKGQAKSWSKRAEEIFGWTAEEFIGRSGLSQYCHDDLPKAIKLIEELVTLKTRSNYIQHCNVTKDGRTIWCKWFNSVVLDKNGEVISIISLVRDVTEQKAAIDLLVCEQMEKEALINATEDMIWSVGKTFKLIAANKAFIKGIEGVTGITLKSGDSTFIDVFPEDMMFFWKESYSRVLAGETLKEEVYIPPNELYPECWRETSFEPIYRDNAVIGAACHSRDITERKLYDREKEIKAVELGIANQELLFQNIEKEKLAAELTKANKELAFQNNEKEKHATELIKANKELTAFTYVSSHDLQEPLRKIQTLASHLLAKENKNLSAKGKNYFRLLQDSAMQMRTLITDLLTFSHVNTEAGQFENADLRLIIDEVAAEFKEALDEKSGRIEVNGLSCSDIIPFQFRQMLHNLIGNAIKYSNPLIPLQITINSKIEPKEELINKDIFPGLDYCHLTIADNGIGFDPEFSERIFEVFQKLHGKEEYAGNGIGLAIVKKIVENHNGFITATGKLGHGAAFDIYLPIMPKEFSLEGPSKPYSP